MIHVFFAERAATKVPDSARGAPVTPVRSRRDRRRRARWAAASPWRASNAGLDVVLTDASDAALEAGIAAIRKNYDGSVARGRLTVEEVAERAWRGFAAVRKREFSEHAASSISSSRRSSRTSRSSGGLSPSWIGWRGPSAVLGDEHVDAGHRCHCRRDVAAGMRSSACTSSVRRT